MPKAVEQMTQMVGQLFEMGSDKSNNAIDLLKQDHRKVEALFGQFERARSNKQNILNQIIKELSIHATVEEQLVYPLLANVNKVHDETAEAYEEHHVVKMMLAELSDMSAFDEKVKAKVCVLKEMVQHHVKEEERELLPQLKKQEVDLQRLAQDILRRKQQIMSGMNRGAKTKSTTKRSTAKKTAKPAAKSRTQARKNVRMKTNRKKSA
jgi:hemerythrin superfamily protein